MVYITVRQPPQYHQMTLEEFLFSTTPVNVVINENMSNTRTYIVDRPSRKILDRVDIKRLIATLVSFNDSVDSLRQMDRQSLYDTFYIPKESGGLRRIDAPKPELMDALRRLKTIFELEFGALYHTSAFAYVPHRSTLDAVKRHQTNESKWFAKFDLSDFFGSTTPEFVMKMLSMVFPFSEVVRFDLGKTELAKALDLCFLNGGLPQGTPISPLITNIMMIPVDHRLNKDFLDFRGAGRTEKNRNLPQRYIYTRYADDFIISSKYDFTYKAIERHIVDVLREFDAPFTVNSKKTRYGSSAGRNWNLGLMLNQDNKITVGHKKKRQFKSMLTHYVLDSKNGVAWDKDDIRVMEGYRNYYRMVERETIDDIVSHIGNKFGVNIVKMIKADLAA